MSTRRYLAGDEGIVLDVRRHGIIVTAPLLQAGLAIVVAAAFGWLTSPSDGEGWVDTAVGLVALAVAARAGWKVWQWWVDRIIVTDQRIFEVSGVLTRKVASMPIARVTDLTYQRSLIGRLLGYGDFIVESAGQDQALSRIDKIPHPDDFYRRITSLVTAGLPSLADEGELWEPDEEDTGPLPQVIV